MSTSNHVYQLSGDAIALKSKDEEKQPLIPSTYSPSKTIDDIYPSLTSGDEGDDEEDSNASDLFGIATSSQVSFIVIGIKLTSN